jgi:DNA invertase Pin-like site-specific DNA recombinase
MNRESSYWRGRLRVPDHAHPLVRQFVRELNEQKTTITEVGERSGVRRTTISTWLNRTDASLSNFVAALNAIGLDLKIVEQGGGAGRPRKTAEAA